MIEALNDETSYSNWLDEGYLLNVSNDDLLVRDNTQEEMIEDEEHDIRTIVDDSRVVNVCGDLVTKVRRAAVEQQLGKN